MIKLRYDSVSENKSISDFKLIDEDYPKKDVFIEYDNEAVKIWEKYISLKSVTDLFERKKLFDSFKSDFYKYFISVPFNVQNIPTYFGDIGYVSNSELDEYYDNDTGFKIKDKRTVIIW